MTKTSLQTQEAKTPDVSQPSVETRVYLPATDIIEMPDHWELVSDMPGVDPSGLNVSIERDTLTIEGKVAPQAPAGHTLAYSEYGVGDFRRQFILSGEVDTEGIEATIKNGVLRMRLPKGAHARTRKIPVKAG